MMHADPTPRVVDIHAAITDDLRRVLAEVGAEVPLVITDLVEAERFPLPLAVALSDFARAAEDAAMSTDPRPVLLRALAEGMVALCTLDATEREPVEDMTADVSDVSRELLDTEEPPASGPCRRRAQDDVAAAQRSDADKLPGGGR